MLCKTAPKRGITFTAVAFTCHPTEYLAQEFFGVTLASFSGHISPIVTKAETGIAILSGSIPHPIPGSPVQQLYFRFILILII